MPQFTGIRIYAVGKIAQNGWRERLFPVMSWAQDWDHPSIEPWPDELDIPSLPGATYVGPHFLSDDHGCYHGRSSHGVAAGGAACGGAYPGLPRSEVTKRCLHAIERSTHVFAWIADPTAYGSLVELGYARALGKQVHLYLPEASERLRDLWFAAQIADHSAQAPDADAAWRDFTGRLAAGGTDAWYTPARIRLP